MLKGASDLNRHRLYTFWMESKVCSLSVPLFYQLFPQFYRCNPEHLRTRL